MVKNYTHAYTTFTVRSVLNPELPNNHGSLAPIKVEAPEGSIVNAVSPQPCTARHVVGMFLPNALLKALAQVRPEQAMAEGSGAVWTMQVSGNHDDGRRSSRRCSPTPAAWARGPPSRACRPARTRPASPPCRSRSSRRRRRSASSARSCAGQRWPGSSPAARARRSSSPSTRPGRGSSTPSRQPRWPPPGHLRRRAGSSRIVHRQRRAGPHPGPHGHCNPATRAPRPPRRRRLRRGCVTEAVPLRPGGAVDTTFLVFEGPDGERQTWTYGEFDALAARAGGCCSRAVSGGLGRPPGAHQLAGLRGVVAGGDRTSAPGSCRPTR